MSRSTLLKGMYVGDARHAGTKSGGLTATPGLTAASKRSRRANLQSRNAEKREVLPNHSNPPAAKVGIQPNKMSETRSSGELRRSQRWNLLPVSQDRPPPVPDRTIPVAEVNVHWRRVPRKHPVRRTDSHTGTYCRVEEVASCEQQFQESRTAPLVTWFASDRTRKLVHVS